MKIYENQQPIALMSADLKLMRKQTCFSIATFLFEDSKTSTSGTHPRGSGWGDLSNAPFTPWDPAGAAGCFAASTWRACTSVLQEGEDGNLWPTASSSCERSYGNNTMLLLEQFVSFAVAGLTTAVRGLKTRLQELLYLDAPSVEEPHCTAACWNTHPISQHNKPSQEQAWFYCSKLGICSKGSANPFHHTTCATCCHLPKYHIQLTLQFFTNQTQPTPCWQSCSPPRIHSDRIAGTTHTEHMWAGTTGVLDMQFLWLLSIQLNVCQSSLTSYTQEY